MQRIFVLLLLALSVVACGHKKDAKSFERALEGSSGQPHSIVKLYTAQGDYVVYKNDVTGEFLAFNMARWDRETMTTVDQFLAVAVDGIDVVRNLEVRSELTTTTSYSPSCDCDTSSTSWVDFYYGGGFRFDNTSALSHDLDTLASLREEAAQQMIAFKLQNEFSLSSTRASELAKLASRYEKLESTRALTQAEKDKFAMDALGVSMGQVERALRARAEGNEDGYERMLQVAAQVNRTTPEQIGRFFTELAENEI